MKTAKGSNVGYDGGKIKILALITAAAAAKISKQAEEHQDEKQNAAISIKNIS